MFVYIVRRIIGTIPTLLGVALLVFLLFNVVGGDPTIQMAGKHATPQLIADIRAEYGLDKPLPMQFLHYLGEMVTFDYGRSYATKQQISDMILRGIGPSLTLTIPAFLITTILGILLGLVVAYFRGTWIDRLAVFLTVVGMSMPMLGLILFGQYVLAYQMGWFPISGFETGWPERFEYVALPVLLWVLVGLGGEIRFFRTTFLDEVSQDYVRTARAKGLSDPRVFLKHVLKNSMVPILTLVVIEIPMLILGAFLLEGFFGIPGIGGLVIDAIHNSDLPVIKAMTTLMALIYVFGQLMTDILYAVFDPRVSLK